MGCRSQNFHVGGIYPFTNSGRARNSLKYQLKTLIIHIIVMKTGPCRGARSEDQLMQGSVWERTGEGSEVQAVLEIKQDCRMR